MDCFYHTFIFAFISLLFHFSLYFSFIFHHIIWYIYHFYFIFLFISLSFVLKASYVSMLDMFLQIHRILLNNRVNYLTLVGRYEEGLIRQRNPKFEALNTQIVASKKLAYTSWLSHEKVAYDIGADESRGNHYNWCHWYQIKIL